MALKCFLSAWHSFKRDKRGVIAEIYVLLFLSMLMIVALAVDYGFYIQAKSQLNLGADAAALQAVRVASQIYASTSCASAACSNSAALAGKTAGEQWFAAQVGRLAFTSAGPVVTVAFSQSPPGFTSTVSYSGSVATHLAKIFGYASFPVSGSVSAVKSNSYIEVVMLLDVSSSMLIGATTPDIVTLETATICSTQSATAGQDMGNYSWNYTGNYGYGANSTKPPTSTTNGVCDPRYHGAASACFYAPTAIAAQLDSTGQCLNGGGAQGVLGPNTPQAPCGFACHVSPATNNDYYALARRLNITLRSDVVAAAAGNVISTLISAQQSAGQFLVGIYGFNTAVINVYPGQAEAGTNLTAARTAVTAMAPPAVPNGGDTDFAASATSLALSTSVAGNGSTQSAPLKYLFIVTDGMQDTAARTEGPITNASNEQICKLFKNKGFSVYVLYTPYLALPNPYYLGNVMQYAEATTAGADSPIVAALRACASSSSQLFEASNAADIDTSMQLMLRAALITAARSSQ